MRAPHAALAATLSLVAPGLASAQPPPPTPASRATTTADRQARSSWRFELRADGTWYENAYFLGPVEDQEAWSTTGRATLGHERRFQDGAFNISGFGGAIYYPDIESLNQPTYGGALGLAWTPSRRTQLRLDTRYERANTRNMRGTDAAGLPLPTTGSDVAAASLALDQQLSQRWQLGVGGSFNYWQYQEEILSDSSQVYANVGLGRSLGRRGVVSVAYNFSSSWFEEGKERSHQGLVGARYSVHRGVGFDIAAGVGYVESTEEFYPAGRATIGAVGRQASLEVGYYRDFGQAYGYGRQTIGDFVFGRLAWTPVSKLTFSASYNLGKRRDPEDETYTIRSGIASGGLSWQVGGGLGFDAIYSWERNETEGLSTLEGSRVTVSLVYGVNWK